MLNRLKSQHKQHLVIKDCLAKECFLKQSKDVGESTKICNSFKHQFVILFCFVLDMAIGLNVINTYCTSLSPNRV
jgi:hypothetical protein